MKLRLAIFSLLAGSAALWLLAGSPETRTWAPPPGPPPKLAQATFAGGCFWCLETAFEGFPGVYSATSGYAGGQLKNPSYEQVSSGGTGHAESVQVAYDPAVVSYAQLLEVFWHNVDPTDAGGQFCDRGSQYRSAVFYLGEEQREAALASKQAILSSGRLKKAIVTEIVPLAAFYTAEAYHQDFYKKDPLRYKTYRLGCGRDRRLQELWGSEAGTHRPAGAAQTGRTGPRSTKGWPAVKDGRWTKPPKDELKAKLTPQQFNVTQQEGTEPPFRNEYWNNHEPGLYVDVVSGEPLFSSLDKFDSGSGWPSFTRPLPGASLASRTDLKIGMPRTEVRSKHADSHLGHVFDDGPAPTGQRYCINSAALRFVPVAQLEAEGYGEYKALFERKTGGTK